MKLSHQYILHTHLQSESAQYTSKDHMELLSDLVAQPLVLLLHRCNLGSCL